MCKLTENSFRDVNIAFANELSLICAEQGINVWELIRTANRHPRVNILQPGPGVGGHCIAVDPWFIVAQNPQQARLIRTAREVNDGKPHWVVDQVKAAVADCPAATDKRASEVKIACFGLAFKPNIDDLRESPAMGIAQSIARWHSGETGRRTEYPSVAEKIGRTLYAGETGRGAGRRRCAGDAGRSRRI